MDTVTFVDVGTGQIVGKIETTKDPIQALLDSLSDDNFKFTSRGVEIVSPPTFQQCEKKVREINLLGKMAPIWRGDLLNYMENRWGEGYAQVLEETGFSYQTIVNEKSVMRRVPSTVRQDGLYFTHYAQVASESHSNQERLLKKAKDEGLNTSEFTRVVRQEKRQASQGKIPEKVEMMMTATFEVPADLTGKLRDLAERWAGRLWEWDIECRGLSWEGKDE